MKKRLLLTPILIGLMAFSGLFLNAINAQSDTIPKLIITEFNCDLDQRNYIEVTNIGDTALFLKDFGLGSMQFWHVPYQHYSGYFEYFPDDTLQPGESYLIAAVRDWYRDNLDPKNFTEFEQLSFTPDAYWEHVDWELHQTEVAGDPTDSTNQGNLLRSVGGQSGYWIEYYFPNGDSLVIDAANNAIDVGLNRPTRVASDVAGVLNATDNHVVVRKTSITRGNLDWEQAKGIDAEDSEWIPLPFHPDYANPHQKFFTTLGNHDVGEISSNSISSSSINIDFDNQVMDVPWGIYRDSIMFEFELGNGLAWNYLSLGDPEDSTYFSTRTGDTLVMWAVGPSLQEVKFHINTLDPSNSSNHVLPRSRRVAEVNDDNELIVNYQKLFGVTENQPGMDSITDVGFGQRVDTLFKYLEKPVNATWEIEWVDGEARPDVKRGDILKVTAESGAVKEYFIAADSIPEPSDNANLASITWPDVPEFTKLSPEWGGEVEIPGFRPTITSYQFTVPYGEGIPALEAIPENINAKITEKRATNLNGDIDERTTVFTVMAEDSSILQYSILFEKEVLSINLQPFHAEPIVTEMIFRQLTINNWLEIANVGNQPLDMSRYLICSHRDGNLTNPSTAITWNSLDYNFRYTRFVLGYDYVTEEEWAAQPGFLKQESYDPIIEPGDVLTIGFFRSNNTGQTWEAEEADIIIDNSSAVEFDDYESTSKKIIDKDELGIPEGGMLIDRRGGVFRDPVHIFKILNDSILEGKKGITDPADFELVELVGGYTNQNWLIDGNHEITTLRQRMIRKEQFWRPDTIPYATFDSIPELNEWYYMDRDSLANALGITNFQATSLLSEGIGSHEFSPINIYKSTIKSKTYLVSDGYVSPQTIVGVDTNTGLESFLENIIKVDEGQSLTVLSGTTGNELTMGSVVASNDTLVVLSADSTNTTKYVLTISEGGLDSDASLVAKDGSGYTIDIDFGNGTGEISGLTFGTSLNALLSNLTKPQTASWLVIDENDALVSLTTVNFDTVNVETMATPQTFIEVTAQDGETKIVYSLVLDIGSSDALLYSDMYTVDQNSKMVSGIPEGTRVPALFTYLHVSPGASAKLLDKEGNERILGNVAYDDMIMVTSEDETMVNTYYLRFLEEAEGTDAYVLSDVLEVDQIAFMIRNVQHNTTVQEFISLLTAAPMADMQVVDDQGNEVTSGIVSEDHKVRVVSGDGEKIVLYELSVLTSVINHNLDGISVYPNPTSGELFIVGLRENSTIKVYNLKGEVLKVLESNQIDGGRISIENQPNGIYLITVTSGNYLLKTLKVIKE